MGIMQRCCVSAAMSSSFSTPPLTLPAGMRATRAMQALLWLLPQQPDEGWTESAVEAALHAQGQSVNRVTVYRALDRLTQAGLLVRSVDAQRITRYWVQGANDAPQAHTYLECTACHQHFRWGPDSAAVQAALHNLQQALVQTGVGAHQLHVAVHAPCQHCASTAQL